MDTKKLQTWLKNRGYYQGNIDGIASQQTREALRKAQAYLKDLGLYDKEIDGIYGSDTESAIKALSSGWRTFKDSGVKFNIYEQNTIDNAIAQLRKKGKTRINFNGININLDKADAVTQLRNAAKDAIKGIRSKSYIGPTDVWSTRDIVSGFTSTAKGSNGGPSSFSNTDLDNLVMRYVYDKYHGTDVDDKEWGISYNYNPHGLDSSLRGSMANTLKIDPNKWTPEQAARIALGAGHRSYYYGGKKYDTNLFTGGAYRDSADFDKQIADIQKQRGTQAAQDAYNNELRRQYNTYGIDYLTLGDKSNFQWNNLFGVVPYGYNAESIGAILNGEQTIQKEKGKGNVSSFGTTSYGYRYDKDIKTGRFKYNNFDEWYQGRVLANENYTANGNLSPTRAVTATYFMGFPVTRQMRDQLEFIGDIPNANDIGRTNYYRITDEVKGAMGAYMYNEAKKNPEGAFRYLRYIYGDRDKNGKVTSNRNRKYDKAEATRLANAAGMTAYHNGSDSGGDFAQDSPIPGIESHDVWKSMRSFYENAFDADGNLKKDFWYPENGYNKAFDGGGYGVVIKDGKPVKAEDTWNVELPLGKVRIDGGVNSSTNGIHLITRFSKLGGLLQYCQSGGVLKGGKKANDKTDESQNMYRNSDSKKLDKDKVYVVNMFYNGSPEKNDLFNMVKSFFDLGQLGLLKYISNI